MPNQPEFKKGDRIEALGVRLEITGIEGGQGVMQEPHSQQQAVHGAFEPIKNDPCERGVEEATDSRGSIMTTVRFILLCILVLAPGNVEALEPLDVSELKKELKNDPVFGWDGEPREPLDASELKDDPIDRTTWPPPSVAFQNYGDESCG